MKALVFKHGDGSTPRVVRDRPTPSLAPGEALVRVLRAGVCATDLEIVRGYVPGYDGVLGHEFVGVVERVNGGGPSSSSLVGRRVVADINFRPPTASPMSSFDGDERRLLARNHEPGRSVLGIIQRDGAMAERVAVPVSNLVVVPSSSPPEAVSDRAAAFAEPLAAALRVVEQGVVKDGDSVAVVGDGRLGLLVAAVLSLGVSAGASTVEKGGDEVPASTSTSTEHEDDDGDESERGPRLRRLVHFGRRQENLDLVPRTRGGGSHETVVVPRGGEGGDGDAVGPRASSFDVVVEASGSSSGIRLALSLCRPMGTVVLKTTCAPPSSSADPSSSVSWAEVANDAVVNEKRLVGSRCGPIGAAVAALATHAELRRLAESMVRAEFPLEEGAEALRRAGEPGALKVMIVCNER